MHGLRGLTIAVLMLAAWGLAGGIPAAEAEQIDSGVFGTCMEHNSTVRCWGDSQAAWRVGAPGPQIDGLPRGTGAPFESLAVTSGTGCVIVTGTIYCWGGIAASSSATFVAAPVDGIPPASKVDLSDQNNFACARAVDASAWCWSNPSFPLSSGNRLGQLGDGTTSNNFGPVRVANLTGVTDVATGGTHSCALSGGVPYCWGGNSSGELGLGTLDSNAHPTATAVPGVKGAVSISAGLFNTCAILADSTVTCWGRGLGDRSSGVAKAIPVLAGTREVVMGNGWGCALTSSGLKCWGQNSGMLGLGPSVPNGYYSTPQDVVGLPTAVSNISGSWGVICASNPDGDAWCWGGTTSYPAIGNGTAYSYTPAKVTPNNGFQPEQQELASPGPITKLTTTGALACGVTHAALPAPAIKDASPPQCGTYVGVYGVSDRIWTGPLTNRAVNRWRIVNSSKSGDGTEGSPRKSVVTSTSDSIQLTETTSYVDGTDHFTTTIKAENLVTNPTNYQLMHAATCGLPGEVTGVAVNNTAQCTSPAGSISMKGTGASPILLSAADFKKKVSTYGNIGASSTPISGDTTIGVSFPMTLKAKGTAGDSAEVEFTTSVLATPTLRGDVNTAPPLRHMSMTSGLECARGPIDQVSSPWLQEGSCGTWGKVAGKLFGPDALGLEADAWVPVDLETSGDGSGTNPWTIKTVVTGGKLLLTETDTYVDGNDHVTTKYEVRNLDDERLQASVSTAGNCFHNNPDTAAITSLGYGWDELAGAATCADRSFAPNTLSWQPDQPLPPHPSPGTTTPGATNPSSPPTTTQPTATFETDTPNGLAKLIEAGSPFTNLCKCGVQYDDAGGLSWQLDLPVHGSASLSFDLKIGVGDPNHGVTPPGGDGPIPWNLAAIGAPQVWNGQVKEDNANGVSVAVKPLTGSGQTVAVVDTGIDENSSWIGGSKMVEEGCWTSQTEYTNAKNGPFLLGTCPTGALEVPNTVDPPAGPGPGVPNPDIDGLVQPGAFTGEGAADPFTRACVSVAGLYCGAYGDTDPGRLFAQGTYVAGLVAGNRSGPPSGVAPDATLIGVNVASWRQRRAAVARPSDLVKALTWVDNKRSKRKIAAVNLMLPGRIDPGDKTRYTGTCAGQSPAAEKIIAKLALHNIAVVVPAGDDGDKKRLPWPACLPSVISVGATTATDSVLPSSNSSQTLSLLAPGGDVVSARMHESTEECILCTANDTTTRSGTAGAAAHVSGAIALYKQRYPKATLIQVKAALRRSGLATRDSNKITRQRLRVDRLITAAPR